MVFTNCICVCISFHKEKACGKHVLEPEHDQLSNVAFSPVSHMEVLTVHSQKISDSRAQR
jgi:hypothetical protein